MIYFLRRSRASQPPDPAHAASQRPETMPPTLSCQSLLDATSALSPHTDRHPQPPARIMDHAPSPLPACLAGPRAIPAARPCGLLLRQQAGWSRPPAWLLSASVALVFQSSSHRQCGSCLATWVFSHWCCFSLPAHFSTAPRCWHTIYWAHDRDAGAVGAAKPGASSSFFQSRVAANLWRCCYIGYRAELQMLSGGSAKPAVRCSMLQATIVRTANGRCGCFKAMLLMLPRNRLVLPPVLEGPHRRSRNFLWCYNSINCLLQLFSHFATLVNKCCCKVFVHVSDEVRLATIA
jgi:hypothetical protein